jgi:hypothetical protein
VGSYKEVLWDKVSSISLFQADAKNAYTSMNKTQYHKDMIHVLTAIVANARPGFQPISRN